MLPIDKLGRKLKPKDQLTDRLTEKRIDYPTGKLTDWYNDHMANKKIDSLANWTINQLRDLPPLQLHNWTTDWPLSYSFTNWQLKKFIDSLTKIQTKWSADQLTV